jgi:4-amino-4-deoxy-L-arabinose transferase-like glycosyltransferase
MSTTIPVEPTDPTELAESDVPPPGGAVRPRMAAPPPITSRFLGWLAGLTLLGFLVRVLNVLWWRPTTDSPGYHGYRLWGDAFYYHWQGNALAHGAWFVDPVRWFLDGSQRPSAGHPPLYPTYLAFWSALGLDGVTAHRLASGVLGTATIVVVALLARRLAGNAAGIVAAAVVALYPQMWINDGMILSETMAIFMTAVALTAAYAFWRTPSMRNACLVGLACGATALSRTELVLLFPLVILPLGLLLKELDWGRRIKLVVVAGLMGALVVGPWIVFNLTRFEETTTMTSGTGSALSAASCDEVWYGKLIGYYANCFQGPWPDPDLDESQRDLVPREQAIEYTKDHIERLPLVVAARVGRLWNVFKPGQTTMLDWWIEGRGRAASWIGLFAYYALWPFAIYGLVVMRRRRVPIFPLIAIALIATFGAAITFGVTRYRAPAEVALVLAASIGAGTLWTNWRARQPRELSTVGDGG